MPKTYLTNYEYLKRVLSELQDDLTKDWREYPCLFWDRGGSAEYGQVFDSVLGKKNDCLIEYHSE